MVKWELALKSVHRSWAVPWQMFIAVSDWDMYGINWPWIYPTRRGDDLCKERFGWSRSEKAKSRRKSAPSGGKIYALHTARGNRGKNEIRLQIASVDGSGDKICQRICKFHRKKMMQVLGVPVDKRKKRKNKPSAVGLWGEKYNRTYS